MTHPTLQIHRVHVERIIDLRHRVLRNGLPRRMAFFESDDAPTTVHLAAIHVGAMHPASPERDAIVGCATVLVNFWDGRPACQLRGMAVDPAYERSGIGRKLLEEVEKVAAGNGVKILWANARTTAIGFYKKLGWTVESEEFEIPTAGPHFKIVKLL